MPPLEECIVGSALVISYWPNSLGPTSFPAQHFSRAPAGDGSLEERKAVPVEALDIELYP